MRSALVLSVFVSLCFTAAAHEANRVDHSGTVGSFSGDWAEVPGAPPAVVAPMPSNAKAFGPVVPAARQPGGALSGRIVFMNSGHGWTWDPNWRLQRGNINEMNEDYGNLDQLNFFAAYCFNAGAVVVSMRPLGQQTNEVVLDNDDPGVTWAGTWFNSTSPVFYGSAGDVPYRYANFAASETATATYTPNIPVAGFYPVYTWVRAGSDRGHQLYRIRHTGGETELRIPHHMVGNGWIYLGEYFFNAGANPALGSVVISNLRGSPDGTYVFADAIRFGNGMGSVARGTSGVSGYPREEESCRYWIQAHLGQGQSTSLFDGGGDDEADSWSAPPKMSAEMNREQEGNTFKRIHISFHSNAGGGRGAVGLITGTPTPNQNTLAFLAGREVNQDLQALPSPPLEESWSPRTTHTYTGGYSEIDGSLFNYEMDATIIEVAFHDSVSDAKLMRDPKVRAAVGRASMHAVVRFMNQFDGAPLEFLPEPSANVRAAGSADGAITLRWEKPASSGGSGEPTGYVIYTSTNGYGFGNPISVGNVTNFRVTGLTAGREHFFRIAAVNGGGESMPSEVVGCRAPLGSTSPRVLVVNAFDRYDRTLNLRQDTTRQAWAPPDATGAIERVLPRRVNAFDYVVPHGQAISAAGFAFDSCQNEAVASGLIALGDYRVVVWACGQESTADESFSSAEQAAMASFRNAGGHLFVSGSEIAWDLDRASGPSAADRAFFNQHLKADFASDANDDSGSHTVAATGSGIFSVRANATFDDGSRGIYFVRTPDVLTPVVGAVAALNYSGNPNGAAAIQYDGSDGGGKVVYLGFPFETIVEPQRRNEYMADALRFFTSGTVTLVGVGALWKYEDSGADFGTAWRATNFNDAAWASGPAQLGFGDGDEATVVNTNRTRITTYFRHAFTVASTGELESVTLRLKRDDGAVVYLNGEEIFRSNMPGGAITAGTPASTAVGDSEESAWFTTDVSPAQLRPGTNVLAVEVHQPNTTSSDLSFDFELLAKLRPAVPVTLLRPGSTWRFRDDGVNLGTGWRARLFNDAAWPSGPARLGFGGDGEVTTLARTNANGSTNITFYFRRLFYVPNPITVQALTARLARDDGALVYLNGTEVWRDNMPPGAIGHGTFAETTVGGGAETAWQTNAFSTAPLVSGWNALAVEVHQATLNSSDLGFDFELRAEAVVPAAPPVTLSTSAVSWPGDAAFYALEFATNLNAPVFWMRVTNEPALVNGRWTTPFSVGPNESRFFRLRAQ